MTTQFLLDLKSLAEKTGISISVDEELAQQALIVAQESITPSPGKQESTDDQFFATKASEVATLLGISAETLSKGLMHDALYAAQNVTAVDLNVYLVDGATVIGTYRVYH